MDTLMLRFARHVAIAVKWKDTAEHDAYSVHFMQNIYEFS